MRSRARGGTGKTTLALHFLRAGAAAGERALYVSLSIRPAADAKRIRIDAAIAPDELVCALDRPPGNDGRRR